MGVFVSIARALARAVHASRVLTCFTPLTKVRAVVVMVDADEPGAQELVYSANKFFTSRTIRTAIFAVSARKNCPDLMGATMLTGRAVNWFGKPRRGRRRPPVAVGEELFVNMVERECFTSEYCALASKAVFKVGRASSSKGIYNMFVSSDGHNPVEVFTQMSNLLDTVK
ncbi:MAG: hypothetical protein J6X77_04815 [Bacteroidales bacterium]|nr:hypothetical protein [Bacteroidales bacterium]